MSSWSQETSSIRQCPLNGPAIGMGDELRKAFAQKGGHVLVVESVLSGAGGEILSTEDIKTMTPVEIFQNFYRYKFGESGSDTELDELLTIFNELLDISMEQEILPHVYQLHI